MINNTYQITITFFCITFVFGVAKLLRNIKTNDKRKFRHLIGSTQDKILGQSFIWKKWRNVGRVNQLYTYPLLSVRRRMIMRELNLISKPSINNSIYYDNMFVVYDLDTKCVRTDEKLKCITFNIEDGFIVKFSAPSMPPILLDMKKIMKKVDFTECVTSFAEKFLVNIKFIDCGEEITAWISTYLKCNVGLGYIRKKEPLRRTFWFTMKELYNYYKNDLDDRNIEIPYNFLPECKLLMMSSLHCFYKIRGNKFADYQFNPNIVINLTKPFEEDEWIWIKIGEVILRNIRPWPKHETEISPKHIPVEMRANLLLLYCHVFFPGVIKQGDNVYIYANSEN